MKILLRSNESAEIIVSNEDDVMSDTESDGSVENTADSAEAGPSNVDDIVTVSDTDGEYLQEEIKELQKVSDKKYLRDYISSLIHGKEEMIVELQKQKDMKDQHPNLQYDVIATNYFHPEFDFVSKMTSQFYIPKCKCKKKCIDCVSRKSRIECHPNSCKSKKTCTNNVITKCRSRLVYIKDAGDKGFGLFAGEDIPKETFICEYVGEIIKRSEMIKRVQQKMGYFILDLRTENGKLVAHIDSNQMGNCARMINHSCDPNASYDNWVAEFLPRVAVYSIKDIKKDEEICVYYGIKCEDGAECKCGATNCQKKLPF